ncbi:MAG: hypothetical protein Q8T13_08495 [Acidobacteriota bacterium]|nr:hypothetical protein [Acidobacteriota bacterium]
MKVLGTAELKLLALRVLATPQGAVSDANAVAVAAEHAYDDLTRVSVPLIGQVGVAAITGRALHLVARDYPWLRRGSEPADAEGSFANLISCLKQQEPTVALNAAAAVFAAFLGLLVSFIGEPLTSGLLRKAWPDAFSDAEI